MLSPTEVSPRSSSSKHCKALYDELRPFNLILCSFVLHLLQDPFLSGSCCSSVASWWWESSFSFSTSFQDLFKSCKSCHGSGLMELGHIFTWLTLQMSKSAVVSVTSKPQPSAAAQLPAEPAKALPAAALSLNSFYDTLTSSHWLLLRVVLLRPVNPESNQDRLWDFMCFDLYQLFLIFFWIQVEGLRFMNVQKVGCFYWHI